MQNEVTVLAVGERTLAELGAEANHEHQLTGQAIGRAFDHAVLAGHALNAAQDQVQAAAQAQRSRGAWARWLRDNFAASDTLAYHYQRLARNETLLRAELGDGVGIKAGLAHLKGLTEAHRKGGTLRLSSEVQEEALRLCENGIPVREAARIVGVHYNTVYLWRHPDTARRKNEAALKKRAQRRREEEEGRRVLHARTMRIAAHKKGGARAELYAMAERMQDVMGQAHREATDPEERRAYALAGEHYRKMRDEVVRALGVA